MSNENNPEEKPAKPPLPLMTLVEASTIKLLDRMSGKLPLFFTGLAALILGIIVAINFMSLTILPEYVYSVLGLISGYGVYAILYYYIQYRNNKLNLYRERVSLRNKIFHIGVSIVALFILLFLFNVFTPKWLNLGIGGTIIITAFIMTLTVFSPKVKNKPSDM